MIANIDNDHFNLCCYEFYLIYCLPVVWYWVAVPWLSPVHPQTEQIYSLRWHWASSELCWHQHSGTGGTGGSAVSVGDDLCPWYARSSASLVVPVWCLRGWSHTLPRQRWRGQGPSRDRWWNDRMNRSHICEYVWYMVCRSQCVCVWVSVHVFV